MAQNNPKTISSSVGWSSSSKSESSPFKFPLTQPQTLITFGATTFKSFDTLYWWTKYDSPAPKIRKPHSQSLKTWNTTVFLTQNMQKPLLQGHRHPQCHPPRRCWRRRERPPRPRSPPPPRWSRRGRRMGPAAPTGGDPPWRDVKRCQCVAALFFGSWNYRKLKVVNDDSAWRFETWSWMVLEFKWGMKQHCSMSDHLWRTGAALRSIQHCLTSSFRNENDVDTPPKEGSPYKQMR